MKRIFSAFDPRLLRYGIHELKASLEIHRARYHLFRRYPDLRMDKDVVVRMPDRLTLGRDVLIQTGTLIDCGGAEWCDYRGRVTLGDRCAIGYRCLLVGSGEIEMESDTGLAFDVMVISQEGDHLPPGMQSQNENCRMRYEKIVFRQGSWAASGAIILAGAEIGEHAVVGPGAVIKGKVPPHSLAIGNPPRFLPLKRPSLTQDEVCQFDS